MTTIKRQYKPQELRKLKIRVSNQPPDNCAAIRGVSKRQVIGYGMITPLSVFNMDTGNISGNCYYGLAAEIVVSEKGKARLLEILGEK